MNVLRRNAKKGRKGPKISTLLLLFCGVAVFVWNCNSQEWLTLPVEKRYIDADESCKKLPPIRPSGSYFLDTSIARANSPEGVEPSFAIGSVFKAGKATYHMGGDVPYFELIREFLKGKEGGLVFDIGANQGFYTYYLASLGMQVHSFEIGERNFKALQHGAEFNPSEVSKRVHAYPVGLNDKNSRFGIMGNNYEGRLTDAEGTILGASFDCFAHHVQDNLDLSDVKFVKIDVEGSEIAVLKGAQNSLLQHSKVGAIFMEVGPNRWSRASISLQSGVVEMKKLAKGFNEAYILLRQAGTCPRNLWEGVLSDSNPRNLSGDVTMHKVTMTEWEPLLTKMKSNDFDCNFFYKN